jgi:hypothetical protein
MSCDSHNESDASRAEDDYLTNYRSSPQLTHAHECAKRKHRSRQEVILMQGFLKQQSFITRDWQKGWFVLLSTMLLHIKNGEVAGSISLENPQEISVVRVGDEEQHIIEVSDEKESFKLKASSKEDMDNWLDSLPAHSRLEKNWPFKRSRVSALPMQPSQERTLLAVLQQQRQGMSFFSKLATI